MRGAHARLTEKIRERAASVVLYELQDPRIDALVTITKAELARDLLTCKIFWSVYGSEGQRSKVAHALEDARGYVQREVARVLHTRVTPHLTFVFDESVAGGARMSALLDQLKKERGEEGGGEGEGDEGKQEEEETRE